MGADPFHVVILVVLLAALGIGCYLGLAGPITLQHFAIALGFFAILAFKYWRANRKGEQMAIRDHQRGKKL